jgi:hypothetical protein
MNLPILTPDNLQIVTMEAPYFTLRTSQLAREIFGKILGVRLNAYLQDYGEGVFPLGKEDFLSELVIICIKDKLSLEPVYSFKITMLDTCNSFNIPFPIASMLQERYGKSKEFKTIQDFLAQKLKNNAKLAYFGSRSKSIELPWNKESAGLLYHAGVSALVNCCDSFGIDEFILFAMLNNGAFKYCEMLGMERVLKDPVIIDSLASSEGYVMNKIRFSSEALDVAGKYSSFWEKRIHIAATGKVQLKAA